LSLLSQRVEADGLSRNFCELLCPDKNSLRESAFFSALFVARRIRAKNIFVESAFRVLLALTLKNALLRLRFVSSTHAKCTRNTQRLSSRNAKQVHAKKICLGELQQCQQSQSSVDARNVRPS
jgi:hypothetical protein